MGAGVDCRKGKHAGVFGTPLFRTRLKLAKKTKEDKNFKFKGPGIYNHLNKGMGAVMGENTGEAAGFWGGKNG